MTMFQKKMYTAITFALALIVAAPAIAGRITTEEKSVNLNDEKEAFVEIDFGIGDLLIAQGNPDKLAFVKGSYDPRYFDYKFDYKKKHKSGDLYFDVSTLKGKWSDLNGVDNEWSLEFTSKIPLDLAMDIGAAKCDLNLGGLMISRLDLEIGAADCKISFDEPNKCDLKKLLIDAGASSVYIDKLGNARFELLDFDGSVGSYDIDFSGEFDFDAEADISVGLGSIDIVIPSDVGVRLYTDDSFLSSIDFPKKKFRRIDTGFYESRNWDDAKGHLELDVEIGLGSVDIHIER